MAARKKMQIESQPGKLLVCTPRDHFLNFGGMRRVANKAFGKADGIKGDERTPLVVLFWEQALRYEFDVPRQEVQKFAESLQKELPDGKWAAIAFNALVSDGNECSNIGYLVSREGIQQYRKMDISRHDDQIIVNSINSIKHGAVMQGWRKAAGAFLMQDPPFPKITAPCGMDIEYRLGMDVREKAKADANTITIVSAFGVEKAAIEALAEKRKLVVLNDAHCMSGMQIIRGGKYEAGYKEIEVKKNFQFMKIME